MAEKTERGRTEDRTKRVPLGVPHRKLNVSLKVPGKRMRWLNDHWRKDPARISKALEGGYEFVNRQGITVGEGSLDSNTDAGTLVSRVVGTNPDGTPIVAYLMAIDEELYKEDQTAKQKIVDGIDQQIKRGSNQNKLGKHGYVDKIEYDPGGP